MARAFEFTPNCTWVWTDRNEPGEVEDTQSLLFLRDEVMVSLERMEKRLTKVISQKQEEEAAADEERLTMLLAKRFSTHL
mmetsp:Transcript_29568/g.94865  ORF Transcript_29568/g.94865 Transcript_29568/m.94865 type:complete len:80 (-) Transcript_29568:74-313(-)